MRRLTGAAIVFALALALSGCANPWNDNVEGCGDPPVLAASEGVVVATSCPESIAYEGRRYLTSCVRVPDTRVGRLITTDGGETSYTGARAIRGVRPERALILLGRGWCKPKTVVARAEDFSESELKTLSSPVAVRGFVLPVARRGRGSQDASLSGKVLAHNGCIVIEGEGRTTVTAIWPAGFELDARTGYLTVEDGRRVARVGRRVSLSGGFVAYERSELPTEVARVVGKCRPPYWLVGEVK